MEILGDVGHVESCFGPFRDDFSVGARCTICAKRTIGFGIILDALGGTTRWRGSSGSLF
jgi:hypothetical protein